MNKTILIAGGAAIASLAVGAAGGYFFAKKRFDTEEKIEYPPRKVDEFLPPQPDVETKQQYFDRLEDALDRSKAAYAKLIKPRSSRKAEREEVTIP